MADLSLRLLGDAGSAVHAFGEVGAVVGEVGIKLAEFAKESIKAYNEQVRVDRELKLAAGELSEAFKAQAEALKSTLGVSDDMVMKMQAMLLQYGEAPAAVDKTVKALLDYSAATGTDALEATQRLIKGVDLGRNTFKETGIVFDDTGNKAKDLASMTDALAKKFGGASEEAGNTLEGRTKKAAEAMDDLKKAFGAFLDTAEQKSGILEKLTGALARLNKDISRHGGRGLLGDPNAPINFASGSEEFQQEKEFLEWADSMSPNPKMWVNQDLVDARRSPGIPTELPTTGTGSALTTAGRKALEGKSTIDVGTMGSSPGDSIMNAYELQKRWGDYQKELQKALGSIEDETEKHNIKMWNAEREAVDKERELHDQQLKEWEAAGKAIGGAFTNALVSQLQTLMDGGEMDVGGIIGSVLSVALSFIPGAGPMLAPIGGLIGHAISRAGKHHDGGVVERFHGGGWPGLSNDEVPVIAQTGEHILSRRDVAAMGGPSGVEAAKRGGQGVTVYVSTMDGTTMRETFERQGGRAIFNAVRAGHGSLVPLLGGT